jgi:CheY-specific phosphatase CheX
MDGIAHAQPLDHEIGLVVKVVEPRTLAFLRDELGFEPVRLERHIHDEKSVVLRAITAIVAVGSRAGLYIGFSYDVSLIRAMTKAYTASLQYQPDEEELYVRETASDIVNVIVGNSTADLASRGELITLSPPVLMVGARTIHSRDGCTVAALTANFAQGALDIAFVGPKILFDQNLNYQGAA